MRRANRRAVAVLGALSVLLAACEGDVDQTAAPPDDTDVGAGDAGEPLVEVGDDVVRGAFSGVAMVHQTTYGGADVEEETDAWDGSAEPGGPYSYAAIPCNQDAPVNNISSDLPTFNTLIEGSRVPSSMRAHPMEFEVVEGDDGDARLEGTIEFTVCQLRPGVTPDPDPVPDDEKYQIELTWSADFDETTDEQITWRGEFEIVGGTGIYEDLTGEGTIAGYFLCFDPDGCSSLGEYADGQFSFMGTYEVPADVLDEASAPLYAEAEPETDAETEPEPDEGDDAGEPGDEDRGEEPVDEPVDGDETEGDDAVEGTGETGTEETDDTADGTTATDERTEDDLDGTTDEGP